MKLLWSLISFKDILLMNKLKKLFQSWRHVAANATLLLKTKASVGSTSSFGNTTANVLPRKGRMIQKVPGFNSILPESDYVKELLKAKQAFRRHGIHGCSSDIDRFFRERGIRYTDDKDLQDLLVDAGLLSGPVSPITDDWQPS